MAAVHESGYSAKPENPIEEQIEQAHRTSYLTTDPDILGFLGGNEITQEFRIIASPVSATINLTKRQEEIKRCRIEVEIAKAKCNIPTEELNKNGLPLLDGVRIFLHDQISGAREGWKGRLCTENVRQVKITTKE